MTNSNPDQRDLKELVAGDPLGLDRSLAQLDPVPLLLVYTHLSGDETLLEKFRPHIQGAWSFEAKIPEDLQAELRAKVTATFKDYVAHNRPLPPAPETALLQRMCDVAVGQAVPSEYLPMVLEELNFDKKDAKSVPWRKPIPRELMDRYHVLVIGSGYSGLAMAIKLKEAGIPFTVVEKNKDVGGTWYENSYPGIAVDTPNHFYSYSFRTSSEWNHYFAQGPEIISYIRTVYSEAAIGEHMRFEEEVARAVWDEAAQIWTATIRRKDGDEYTLKANVLVSGTGLLNRPSIPSISGLEHFKGPKFHSSRWDHNLDLTGKTVVQIGTGASGMQLGPQIAPKVAHLTIFQRSPHWARKNPLLFATVSDGLKWGLEHVPFYTKWWRFQLLYATSDGMLPHLRKDPDWSEPETSLNAFNKAIREQLIADMRAELNGDEELLAKVTPSFPPYGKRMLRDSRWFSTLTRDNVELVTGSVQKITETGVVDKDGAEHPADVIILATGFKAQTPLFPMEIVGTEGSLREHWGEDDPRAHLGITVPKFPNLFILYGPGTNGGHGGSAVFNSECQVRYTMLALRELIEREATSLEVRREPFDAYQAEFDAEHEKLVWSHPGVTNWYRNKAGRVVTNNPWRLSRYRNMTAVFIPGDYIIKNEKVPA